MLGRESRSVRRVAGVATALAALLIAPVGAGAATLAPGSTTLVSRGSGFGALPTATDNTAFADAHAISGDGRYVVFISSADDLGSAYGLYDHAWVRDTTTDQTKLLDQVGGVAGDLGTDWVSISEDGSTACFVSSSRNLAAGAGTGLQHVYAVNIATGAITLVDRATGTLGAIGDNDANSCALSADGSRVAFDTRSSNLVPNDTNGAQDVFVRTLGANTTQLVDVTTGGQEPPGGASDPAIDASGTRIAFDAIDPLDPIHDTNTSRDVYVRDTGTLTTILISRADGPTGAVGAAASSQPAISDDGTKIAFQSDASNLVTGDSNGLQDVFVRDTTAGTTQLVDRATGSGGAIANAGAAAPAISGDGTGVLFSSDATNLPGGVFAIYVRLLATNETFLVSVSGGFASAPDNGLAPFRVPSSGTTPTAMVWTSQGSNLDSTSAPGYFSEVFKRVRPSLQSAELVSRPSGTATRLEGVDSSRLGDHSVSADGRYVAFLSTASAIDPAANHRVLNAYVRDLATGTTTLVSRAAGSGGVPANDYSADVSISADGSHVAFFSTATNLVPGVTQPEVYVRDLRTGQLVLASRADGPNGAPVVGLPFSRTSLNADGSRVAFNSTVDGLVPADVNGQEDVYVRDIPAGRTFLASTSTGGSVLNGESDALSLDAAGRHVAFGSNATNVGDGVTTGFHVHVRDLAAGTTTLVDRADGAQGTPSASGTFLVDISADGNRVAFTSNDALTSDAGAPGKRHVYVRDLAAARTLLASRADGPGGAPLPQALFGSGVAMSLDGNHVLFDARPAGTTDDQVDERDLVHGVTTLVSAANGSASLPDAGIGNSAAVNADGSCVAFEATADNLATPDYHNLDFAQVYLRAVGRTCPLPATVIPPPPTPPAPAPAPKILSASLSHTRFRTSNRTTARTAARRGSHRRKRKPPPPTGTTIRWRVSVAATLTITIDARIPGWRSGARCVARRPKHPRHPKRCTIIRARGTLTRHVKAGAGSTPFTGRISGSRRLAAGSYQFVLVAIDARHRRSAARTLRFTVVR